MVAIAMPFSQCDRASHLVTRGPSDCLAGWDRSADGIDRLASFETGNWSSQAGSQVGTPTGVAQWLDNADCVAGRSLLVRPISAVS